MKPAIDLIHFLKIKLAQLDPFPLDSYVAPTSPSAVYSLLWGRGLRGSVAGLEQRVDAQVRSSPFPVASYS